jgi:hypothetical protein
MPLVPARFRAAEKGHLNESGEEGEEKSLRKRDFKKGRKRKIFLERE